MHLRRVLPLGAAAVVAACSQTPNFGAPDAASREGGEILGLWRGSVIAALTVGALVWILIVWTVIRYRRKDDALPDQTALNIPLEIAYTVAPIVIVAVLFGFTVVTQQDVTALSDDPDVVIDVTGFQWSWQFAYPEEGVRIEGNGLDPPELVVPVGTVVRFNLESVDVAHSFWVPRFLVKRDLIPGVENAIDVEVNEEGVFVGRCAEFCGLDHYRMNFSIAAVPMEEYVAWLDERAEEAS